MPSPRSKQSSHMTVLLYLRTRITRRRRRKFTSLATHAGQVAVDFTRTVTQL
jgi:hypothetical protein